MLALPLLIKIFLEKDLDIAKERRNKELEVEEKGKDGERTGSGDINGSLGSAPPAPVSSSNNGSNSNSNSNSNSSNNSNSSSRGGITSATIMHIFDAEMIQLVMQDVIGMTSHGISTFTAQGGALERTASQEREVEKDKEGENKDGYSRLDAEERTGEDFEKGGKREIVWDTDDALLRTNFRKIPREDVAEVLVQALVCKDAIGKSAERISSHPIYTSRAAHA